LSYLHIAAFSCKSGYADCPCLSSAEKDLRIARASGRDPEHALGLPLDDGLDDVLRSVLQKGVMMQTSSPDYPVAASDLRVAAGHAFVLDIARLHVSHTETVALVGHNGSGKSTLLEALLGLRKRVNGVCTVLGADWHEQAPASIRSRVGVQLHGLNHHPLIRVSELVAIYRSAYGDHDREFAELFAIDDLARKTYGKLSKGERQRTDLFLAMAHRPDLVVFDEPTSGLDRGFQTRFQNAVLRLRRQCGSTIIIATHSSAEVELADRIVWLERGRIVANAPRDQLIRETVGELHANVSHHELPLNELKGQPAVVNLYRRADGSLSIFARQDFEQQLIDVFRMHDIHYFSLAPSSADDFLSLITDGGEPC
jgi:ABC-2 type transport system ATP-binding protein